MIKIHKKKHNQRTHTWFKTNELTLIQEAIEKVEAISNEQCTFSYFVRQSALRNAERLTGKRVAP